MSDKVIRLRRLMLELRAERPRPEYAYNQPNMVVVERVRAIMRREREKVKHLLNEDDYGQSLIEERSLDERIARCRVESLNLWPDDLETLVTDRRYFAWLRALPDPAFARIMARAERVRRDRAAGDDSLLDPDLTPTPTFDQLEEVGLAVMVTLTADGLRLPEVK